MTFVDTLNEYIVLTICLLVTVFFIGIRLGFKYGGWNRNLVYLWTLIIYSMYTLITPTYFYLTGRNTVIGTDISEYYGLGFAFNTLAISSFVLGYWITGNTKNQNWTKPPLYEITNPKKIITILFYVMYGIVLINLAVGGYDIQQVFVGNEVLGLGASGGSYFLQNFTDSLIIVLVLAFFYDVNSRTLLIWIAISFFLFSLLGFRYRILLTMFGFLFVFLYKYKIDARRIALTAAMGLVFFYGIMFSTENRRELITREYDELIFDPLQYDYERFFDQTRGALPDMAVYRYYDNPNKVSEYDYGLTMFGYVFIRMIPRSIYPDKDKFYPPPQLATTIKAYDAWWAKYAGEATLSVAALYIAFGWLGIVAGHFFWALIIRRVSNKIRFADKIKVTSYVVIALASFQWITRGYLPQVIDHFVYMMIPVWIMRFYSTKNTGIATD
ncbi:MAG: hypothetical protein EOO04_28935 [Chitinophagaceae bacterium]|nr:MAG: hypothetical protein EOO04_28935 [Chitinophagaceae bacterium]